MFANARNRGARFVHTPDIASILNRLGIRTAKGRTWTQDCIAAFRSDHNIAVGAGEHPESGSGRDRDGLPGRPPIPEVTLQRHDFRAV